VRSEPEGVVRALDKLNPVPESARFQKVVLLAYDFPPTNLAGAARPWRFYRYLPESGYEPLVITASLQDPAKTPAGVIHVPDLTEDSIPYGVRWMARTAIRKTIRPGDIGMLWVPDALRAVERLLWRGPVRAIYSTFPALNAHLVALNLKRRYGLPWVADFRDPLCGNPFSAHTSLSRWFEHWMERTIFAEADILIGVTDRIVDRWRERYPQYAHKMHTIWNGFDPEDLICARPIAHAGRARVMAHIGSFYGGRTPATVLGSILRLVQSGHIDPSAFRLRFVGDYGSGFFTPSIQVTFDNLARIGCLEFEDRQVPRSEALRVMTESDYLYLADNSSSQSGYTVPAKLFEYVQVGRPILATTSTNSPVDYILRNSGIPYATLPPDATDERVDTCLAEFLKLPSDPVTSPSPWFHEKFDGRRQTGALAAFFDSVLR